METHTSSFGQLIAMYKINIPIIQRDYAQGRTEEEERRTRFLNVIYKHLTEDASLDLDFVYGRFDKSLNTFYPIDGQQRLTTLYLLHWYLANTEQRKSLHNFTYDTRVSSREFCEHFVNFKDEASNESELCKNICKQPWFSLAFGADPTIQAMLTMLGHIQRLFKKEDKSTLFQHLNKITFQILDLGAKGFELTDELYIKMNARGKQLTAFENFKADLVGFIKEKGWENSKEPKETIAHKLDTTWTDIFWKYRSEDCNIDNIYFAFINRFFTNSLITAKKDDDTFLYTQTDVESNTLFKYLENEKKFKYHGLEIYKEAGEVFNQELLERLKTILDNFHKAFKEKEKDDTNKLFLPSWDKNSEFCFIPGYSDAKSDSQYLINTITQSHRVVFHAICCYFEKNEYNEVSFKQWIRVVWNIVENANVNSASTMIGVMRLIDELKPNNIYEFLSKSSHTITSKVADEQLREEKEKAQQMVNGGPLWGDKIIDAEKTAFFKGAIRFLFRTNDDKDVDWSAFDFRFTKAKDYFDINGVKDVNERNYRTDALLLKAFVSRVENFWGELWEKEVFDNESTTWKKLLTKPSLRSIMNIILSGEVSVADKGTDPLHKKLYQTELLPYIAKSLVGARVRNNTSLHKAIYPARYSGIILDMDKRDKLLSELIIDKTIKVDDGQIVENTSFFNGWNIYFKWNKSDSYKFQWDKSDRIHLLNKKNEPIVKGTHLFFDTDADIDKERFIEKLNKLLNNIELQPAP